ncbi:RNA pyrophosphohydrolase [Magnetospirillum sp. 64-120]|uniref:RNA pyrophosphohydrolase n=1 Tax=Magnetospirillum sp. 64-120 TaxID=1895778 RepID=UPI00092C964B|nr:RNA pyrophosphohydrolase [Magnetospirillum sp. 64-120]OJX77386.1 MAG: RNA pyrophosphohydrolase [Magnetospirillum sp. 64-120]
MSKPLPLSQRPYRPGVGILLFNAQGQVFAAKRIDTQENAWQFPQGGIDEGEDPATAAKREMVEEIGTDKAQMVGESAGWISYDLPADLADKVWKGRFRGQKQKWFAFQFLGTDADINIDTEHPEFSEWRWMELAEVPGLIVAFKKPLYDQVAAEFAPLAARLKQG